LVFVDGGKLLEEKIQTYWQQRQHYEEKQPLPSFYSDGNSLGAVTWFKASSRGEGRNS